MSSRSSAEEAVVPVEAIAQAILILRGQKVILDADLARLYGVTTTRLNQQVRRNAERFPADFMFQITTEELRNLMLQNATSSWGGRRKLPFAFTEHGALMAATVLSTPRAVEVGVYVVRAFIRLRELLASHAELSHKLIELEDRLDGHDEQIGALMAAIRQLLAAPEKPERQIGFRVRERRKRYAKR
ncbi:MAG: ORF6N domain-containing protein [Armatimonadota bacterium]|nr:ORF6N domain-containing protein [Armatimonadota bacterium]